MAFVTAITADFVAHLNASVGDEHTEFTAVALQKFDKIIVDSRGQKSVHAFIERSSGDLIKAASWKAPQKDKQGLAVRFQLATNDGMARACEVADRLGSYLYQR